jgi:hypothetical protein
VPDSVMIISGTRAASLDEHVDQVDLFMYSFCRWWAPSARTFLLVEGEQTGVDLMSKVIAQTWRKGWEVDPVRANWDLCGDGCPPGPHRKRNAMGEYCPYAGPRRNRFMLEKYPEAPVLAIPRIGGTAPIREQSKGTWRMIDLSIELGHSSQIRPLRIAQGLW